MKLFSVFLIACLPFYICAQSHCEIAFEQLKELPEDSSLYFIEKINTRLLEAHAFEDMVCFSRKAGYYLKINKQQPKEAIGVYQQIEGRIPDTLSNIKIWKNYGLLLIDLGYTYLKSLSKVQEAIVYYKAALQVFDVKVGTRDFIGHRYACQPLGNCYTRIGDYERAIVYLKRAYGVFIAGDYKSEAAEAASDLGIAYEWMNDWEGAKKIYLEAFTLENVHTVAKAKLKNNLAMIYFLEDKIDTALLFNHAAKDIVNKSVGLNDTWAYQKVALKREIADLFAQIYFKSGQLSQSEIYLQKAIQLDLKLYDGREGRSLAKLKVLHGDLLLKQGDVLKALEEYQQAIRIFSPEWGSSPMMAVNTELLVGENTIAEALLGKAKSFRLLYDRQLDKMYLQLAIDAFKSAFAVYHILREDYQYESSHFNALEGLREPMLSAIDASFLLWEHWNDQRGIEQAFQFSQFSKNIRLSEYLAKSQALLTQQIPEELIKRQLDYRQQLIRLEKDKMKRNVFIHDSLIFNLKNQLAEVEEEMVKYDTAHLSLNSFNDTVVVQHLQKVLAKDEVLLDYFLGDSSLFVFKCTVNGLSGFRFDGFVGLKDGVQKMLAGLYNWVDGGDFVQYTDQYILNAHELYTQLIEPIGPLPNQLIVIPDDVLGYLPFETLLVRPVLDKNDFKKYPYLLKEKVISYGYSVNIWLRNQALTDESKMMKTLAVAPLFGGSEKGIALLKERDKLIVLKNTLEEVKGVNQLVGGNILSGEAATKEQFIAMLPRFNIAHLATHAVLNEEMPELSFIAFTGASSDGLKNQLHILDLYHANWPLEMVVLSACETGAGNLQEGEGIISLGRGLTAAGVKSIITTLWKVNDRSAKDMMLPFYRYLKNGNKKSYALQQAKIDFINQQEDDLYAHPYYWSSFIAIGNMSALQFDTTITGCYGLLFLGLILILFFYLNNFNKK